MRAELAPERFRVGMGRQLEALAVALAQGMPRRGWKVGLNVPEVQARVGLPHAGVGWLDGRRVLASGARLEGSATSRLHVEPELALVLGTSLAGAVSAAAGRAAIASVHAALEIVDYARPASGLDDVIAHSMFHSATVLGSAHRLDEARELGTHWPSLCVGTRPGSAPRLDLVPQDLGELVAFVAAYLKAFGASLDAGDLILSGSYLATVPPIAPGEIARADFGPLGSVSLERAAHVAGSS